MPIEIDRLRHRKSATVQRRHVRELARRRDTRQVQPGGLVPASVIVALLLHVTEARATEPMQLQTQRLVIVVAHRVDVRLLADADLVAERGDRSAQRQRLERQVVVAGVGETVAVD